MQNTQKDWLTYDQFCQIRESYDGSIMTLPLEHLDMSVECSDTQSGVTVAIPWARALLFFSSLAESSLFPR